MLTERLDFNFSWNDITTVDNIFQDYIEDRIQSYNEIFKELETIDSEEIKKYLHFFINFDSNFDYDNHPNLERLYSFLDRDYEIFTIPSIIDVIPLIHNSLLPYYIDEIQNEDDLGFLQDICEKEYDVLTNLKENWETFILEITNFPMLNLDNMDYENINGVQVYIDKNTKKENLDSFLLFLENIGKEFPNVLLRLDSFLLLDSEYIELVGGEGTKAYFLEDSIFYSNSFEQKTKTVDDKNTDKEFKKKEDKMFTIQSYYHEFGHFIFSLLSETYVNYWKDCYAEWEEKKVKMTRSEDRNSQLDVFCEELFCDSFACLFVDCPDEDYYIHNPSEVIIDSIKFILREEFN